ncbi:MAG TPA: glycosyltransferase [Patescibacteria group bacterium]|nr:glycosyltransferase [Patescibacteria group bacterium]
MKIALVHEFLNQLGGAEKVLQNFLEIWPEAEIHVILYDKHKTLGEFEKYKMTTSFLNRIPGTKSHPRLFLLMMPGAIESFKFDDFELVISDSSSFAKGVKTDKPHICYMHTPTRFLWTESEYINQQKYPDIFKWFGKRALPGLKKWDFDAAQRPDFLIANSLNVQDRIKKFYNRESVVIPPPVDTEFFHTVGTKQDYFFTVSRLEPYKKIDVIVEAFNELGLPLKIAGIGTAMSALKKLAKPNVEFLGRVPDEELRAHYSQSKAFVFAGEEDAGIALIEAQACGTPVLAFRAGGAKESVIAGGTGEFFEEQNCQSLVDALRKFNPGHYDIQAMRANAEKFSKRHFQAKIKEFVEEKYNHKSS